MRQKLGREFVLQNKVLMKIRTAKTKIEKKRSIIAAKKTGYTYELIWDCSGFDVAEGSTNYCTISGIRIPMPRLLPLILLLLLLLPSCQAQAPPSLPPIEIFFSPSGGCTDAVVKEINAANTDTLVQAYSFTSVPYYAASPSWVSDEELKLLQLRCPTQGDY